MTIKDKAQKGRFAIVGVANTVIDFGVLFLLKILGLPEIPANIISTSTALCFSFFASKKYTFRAAGNDIVREMVLFIIISLFGAWVIQSLIILGAQPLLERTGLHSLIALFVAKVAAVGVGLVWNYVMYSRFVFKNKETL